MLRVPWREVKQAFAIFRHERVEIDERTNSRRNSISNASDYAATVGVSAENYANGALVVEPLVQCLDLVHCERRIDVINAYIRR